MLLRELADGLKKRQTLYIAYCAADFNKNNVCGFVEGYAALDFVCDVRNNLNCLTAVNALSLVCENGVVNAAGGYVAVLRKTLVNKSLVVTEVKVCLCTVVGNKNLTVLYRVHCAGVNVEVRVKLCNGDFESPCF